MSKKNSVIIFMILFLFAGPGINANEKMLSDAMNAVSSGDKEKIKKIIKQNNKQDFKNKLLWDAAHKKNHEIVNILLENGADVAYHPDGEFNLLMSSIHSGSTKIVAALLLHGADPDEGYGSEDVFESPLTAAIDNDNLEVIQLLLENGADPYGVYQSEIPPALIYAIRRGEEKAVKFLLSKNIDPNTLTLYYGKVSTALKHAIDQDDKNVKIIEMLKSAGAKEILTEKELTFIAKNHKSERMRSEAAFALQQMKSVK